MIREVKTYWRSLTTKENSRSDTGLSDHTKEMNAILVLLHKNGHGGKGQQ